VPRFNIHTDNKDLYISELLELMLERNHWGSLVKNEIISSPDHQYVFTSISKNACTQIKFVLADMLCYPNKFDRQLSPHNLKNTGLISVAGLKDKQEIYRLLFNDEVFRFAFVRNPLARLISAFDNKLSRNFNTLWEESRKDHLDNLYTNLAIKIKSDVTGTTESTLDIRTNPLSFKEFIYFVYHQDTYDMDRHWYPQNRAMFHDLINYQLIGKVENFANDFKTVLENINAPDNIYDFTEKQNASQKKISLSDFYDTELEKIVVKKYEEDFDLFKYPKYQIRTFQSLSVNEEKIKPLTYSQKLYSIDISDPLRKIGVILWTSNDSIGARNTIKSVRNLLGNTINIYLGIRGGKSMVFEDIARCYDVKVNYFQNKNISETLNELISIVEEKFVLSLSMNMISPDIHRLYSTLKLFNANDKVKIINGSIHCPTDQEDKKDPIVCNCDSSIIFYDKILGQLTLTPSSNLIREKYFIDKWEYSFVDTVSEVFLADKSIFDENRVWFDNDLQDLETVMLDLSLKIWGQPDIGIVDSNCLALETASDSFENKVSHELKIDDLNKFLLKWNINKFEVIGISAKELTEDEIIRNEEPVQSSIRPESQIEMDDKNADQQNLKKIVELNHEISLLHKEISSFKNSLSWKITQPLRSIASALGLDRFLH
jgi:dermatan 4-sulfotransferase 1